MTRILACPHIIVAVNSRRDWISETNLKFALEEKIKKSRCNILLCMTMKSNFDHLYTQWVFLIACNVTNFIFVSTGKPQDFSIIYSFFFYSLLSFSQFFQRSKDNTGIICNIFKQQNHRKKKYIFKWKKKWNCCKEKIEKFKDIIEKKPLSNIVKFRYGKISVTKKIRTQGFFSFWESLSKDKVALLR